MRQSQKMVGRVLVALLCLSMLMVLPAGKAGMLTLRPSEAQAMTGGVAAQSKSTAFTSGNPLIRKAVIRSQRKEARKAYRKKLKRLLRDMAVDNTDAFYLYKDVYGDSVEELICQTKESAGSEDDLRVYMYKDGKVKLLCHTKVYGLDKLKFFKSSKGFAMHSCGHGGEISRYFRMSKGKYRLVAMRSRTSVLGGAAQNGSWTYLNRWNQPITASEFKRYANKVAKGSARTIDVPSGMYRMAG